MAQLNINILLKHLFEVTESDLCGEEKGSTEYKAGNRRLMHWHCIAC